MENLLCNSTVPIVLHILAELRTAKLQSWLHVMSESQERYLADKVCSTSSEMLLLKAC